MYSGTVKLSAAKTKLAFSVKTLHAKHGKITLRMSNPSGLQHAIAVNGHSGKIVGNGVIGLVERATGNKREAVAQSIKAIEINSVDYAESVRVDDDEDPRA